jgi:hypothetical protein
MYGVCLYSVTCIRGMMVTEAWGPLFLLHLCVCVMEVYLPLLIRGPDGGRNKYLWKVLILQSVTVSQSLPEKVTQCEHSVS